MDLVNLSANKVDILLEAAIIFNGKYLKKDLYFTKSKYKESVIRNIFGSWNMFLVAANIEINTNRHIKDIELFSNLHEMAERGFDFNFSDASFKKYESRYSRAAYKQKFKTASNIRKLYYEWCNPKNKDIIITEYKCYVYILYNKAHGFYKIGIAKDVEKRLKSINKNFVKYEITISKAYLNTEYAKLIERHLHKVFSDKNVNIQHSDISDKELFYLKEHDIKLIKCLLS